MATTSNSMVFEKAVYLPSYVSQDSHRIGNNMQVAVGGVFDSIRNDEFRGIHTTLDQNKAALALLLTCPSCDNNQLGAYSHIIVYARGNFGVLRKRLPS